jgi:L-ribulose-5-phosphate 4-epimerase
MDSSLNKLKEMIVAATGLLFSSGVMQYSGHGNLSARLGNDRMILTSKGNIRGLTAGHLALVSFNGNMIEGQIDPGTAEIVAMHAGVYRVRDQVGAIIHTHSPHVTAFALANKPLPSVYEVLLRFGIDDAIPVTAWAPRGSEESVSNIVKQLEDHPTASAVLLANHGLLAFGPDPLQTAQLVIGMEEAAEATLAACLIGGVKPFPGNAIKRVRRRMARFSADR